MGSSVRLLACLLAVSLYSTAFAQEQRRAFLGVQVSSHEEGEEGQKGAVVGEVVPDSPAAKAGLKTGDVIVSVGDKDINSPEDLTENIRGRKPSDKVEFKIVREGKEQALSVTLGTAPADFGQPRPSGTQVQPFRRGPDGQFRFTIPPGAEGLQAERRPRIGIHLQPLDDEDLRKRLNVQDNEGVLIADVEEGSPAAQADLRDSDVIVEANGQKVSEPKQLVDMISKMKVGDEVSLKILRDGKELTKKVTLKEMPVQQFRLPNGQFPDGFPFNRPQLPNQPGMQQFRFNMVPLEQFEAMQKRVEQLERRVQELTNKLEGREGRRSDRPQRERSSDSEARSDDDRAKVRKELDDAIERQSNKKSKLPAEKDDAKKAPDHRS